MSKGISFPKSDLLGDPFQPEMNLCAGATRNGQNGNLRIQDLNASTEIVQIEFDVGEKIYLVQN
jgi:hypothetical protein